MKKLLALMLALSMAVGACISLASCNNKPEETSEESSSITETDSKGTSSSESGSETESKSETESQSKPAETQSDESGSEDTEDTTEAPIPDNNTVYGNGEPISAAGIDWADGFFSNTEYSINASKAVDISADELIAKLTDRDGDGALKAGEVWHVSGDLVLGTGKYYGNGAAIVVDGNVVIKDSVDVVIKDILIKGSISVESSAEIVLFKVYVESNGVALSADGNSSDITVKTCRFRAGKTSVLSDADNVTVYSCYSYAPDGFIMGGDAVLVQNSKILASGTAVSVNGKDCIVRENYIEVYTYGKGVYADGAYNLLVALNEIKGVQKSITVKNGYNCSVIMNCAISMNGSDNTNLYVVDNKFGGYVLLENNNYLIADGNLYPIDSLDHTLIQINNQNINGNSVTDVDKRVEVGANEEVLPHTNKDLFVGMDRKTSVNDASFTSSKNLSSYMSDCASTSDVIIVPPGAYSVGGTNYLGSEMANKTVYAYGVYQEYSEMDPLSQTGYLLYVGGNANNFNLYGLTVGDALPSCGQVRVVEKIKDGNTYKLIVINDAGFLDGFTTTDPDVFHTWWPEIFLTDENGEGKLYCEENPKGNHKVVRNYDENGNYDGTMTFTITLSGTNDYAENKPAKTLYNRISVGDVITCRLNYGGNSVYIGASTNVHFRDTVIYGHSSGLSVVSGSSKGVLFERHHNTVKSGLVIDKETYDKYVALEEKWGVDFEVEEQTMADGTVLYRGAAPRTGSTDGFHVVGNIEGISITSSILDSMADDGGNQRASSSRLHNIKDNGDGTTTLYYKPMVTSVYFHTYPGGPGESDLNTPSLTKHFAEGDRVYIYTPGGVTLIDAPAVSAAWNTLEKVYINLTYGNTTKKVYRDIWAVTVNTSDINWDALINPDTGEKYDLSDNRYELDNRLSVDNLSANSCGYTVDNTLVHNAHSRGFLVKACDITFKHCTFRNVSNSAFRIMVEYEWGESTVPRNVLIQQCLFDNVGFHMQKYADPSMAVILIDGSSTVASENTLPIDGVTITGCKFTNNKQRFAIRVNSAKNVTITDNTFDNLEFELPYQPGVAVLLQTCMNVELSDNTYNYEHFEGDIRNVVKGNNYINIFGSDVVDEDGNPLLPDNVPVAETAEP